MVSNVSLTNPYFQSLADDHRSWLSKFNSQHLRNWKRLLNGNVEAACCESAVRQHLESFCVEVEPNEQLRSDGGGPDFRCTVNDTHFYVEVTCIQTTTATAKTGVLEEAHSGPANYFGFTEAIFNECQNKAAQCRDMDAPTLLAIGTFHGFASMAFINKVMLSSVLTGKTVMVKEVEFKPKLNFRDSYPQTELEKAAFLRPDQQQEVGFARSSISGLLICGLSISRHLGILHPNPVRSFDPTLIPAIKFGRLELDHSSRQLRVQWPDGDEE